MNKTTIAIGFFTVCVTAAVAVAADPIKMKPPIPLPHAGITLGLPVGFVQQNELADETHILTAGRTESDKTTGGISLLVVPAEKGVTAESFLQGQVDAYTQSLAVRHFKKLGQAPISIAPGLEGLAASCQYSFRGIKTVAVVICFIRDIKPEKDAAAIHVAYLLTMEMPAERKKDILRTLDAVLETMKLTAIQRPIDMEHDYKGLILKDFKGGYSVRAPKGWASGKNDWGITLKQIDFLAGGVACPDVQIVSITMDDKLNSKECGRKYLDAEIKRGLKVDVISEGPAKLAGKDAYQYVVRKSISAPATTPASQPATKPADASDKPKIVQTPEEEPIMQVHRLLTVPAEGDKVRHYAIILTTRRCDVKKTAAMMDKLAENFSLIAIPKNPPKPTPKKYKLEL
ncbi:MAG: hypothetical protein KAR11_05275 [Phycisphaerae bacterium]|nr:hypothetical protein [Phycisphaerae bacterium]